MTIADRIRPMLSPLLQQALDARTQEGLRKYGQTLDANDKPEQAKAVHLLQELLDSCQYAEWLDEDSPLTPLLTKLANDLADEFPDLTLEELLFKEGHSGKAAKPSGFPHSTATALRNIALGLEPDAARELLAAADQLAQAGAGALEKLRELVKEREKWKSEVVERRFELQRVEERPHTSEEYAAAHSAWVKAMDAHDITRRALYSAVGLT